MEQGAPGPHGARHWGDPTLALTDDRDALLAQTFRNAEQAGLKVALKGRFVALALLALWFGLTRSADPAHALELVGAVAGFGLLGLIHYWLIGSRYDRVWIKYAFITIDVVVLCVLVATQPIYDTIEVPQAMIFRNTVFPFLFVILGVAAFSFSPGLVLWAGCAGAAGWLAAFAWTIRDMPVRLDWTDIGTSPSTEQFVSTFLSPNFIGTGSRIQETVAYLLVAVLIAAVMWRARRTVHRQLELAEERRTLSDVFGQYVPKAIADALITDRGLLEPVEDTATVLFIDIAGFTTMTESAGPRRVVQVLNEFFDQATVAITARNGVVTQFIGDGLMATFNLPVDDRRHAENAVLAALDILALCRDQEFDGKHLSLRAGICSGPVIGGSVGGGGRQSYSIYGDTVNLASRLETLNKEHGTELLIGAPTVALLDGAPFREIGRVPVRGLSEPVAVYAPTAETRGHLQNGAPEPSTA